MYDSFGLFFFFFISEAVLAVNVFQDWDLCTTDFLCTRDYVLKSSLSPTGQLGYNTEMQHTLCGEAKEAAVREDQLSLAFSRKTTMAVLS